VTKPHKQSLFEQPNLSPIEAIGDAMRLSFVCRDFSLHQSKLQLGQCTKSRALLYQKRSACPLQTTNKEAIRARR
jgi:hypothetical protein